jgi:GT2 family glycosyltransferase
MKWFTGWRTGRVAPRSYPIAILSFDRPDYLRAVLKSLFKQVSPHDRIILFQDGAHNTYSGRHKADPIKIDSCVRLFHRYFPRGEVHLSDENLGIAWNYEIVTRR